MSKSAYKVTSDEGAEFVARITNVIVEVGGNVNLALQKDEEQAVIAAGWLEHTPKPKEKE